MATEHRNIPDGERHELKGASTALVGSVPVADGVGGTAFQKLGPANFTGSVPTTVPDIVIATDGAGGFKSLQASYGRFIFTKDIANISPDTMTTTYTPQGMFIDGATVKVSTTGFYWYGMEALYRFPTDEAQPITGVVPTKLVRSDTAAVLTTGMAGVIHLEAGVPLKLDRSGAFSLWKIQV